MADNEYKEIIYLDEIELASALAQIDGGLKQSLVATSGSTNSAGHSNSTGGQASGGFNALVAKAQGQASYQHTTSKSSEETAQEAMEISFGDYELEQLLTKLHNTLSVTSTKEGKFTLISSEFHIFDFNNLSQAMDVKVLKDIMKRLPSEVGEGTQWDKSTENGFNLMAKTAGLMNLLLPDSIILKLSSATVYAENSNFRMSPAQLNMLQGTNRKVTVLGLTEAQVGSKKNDMDTLAKEMEAGQVDRFGSFASSFAENLLTALGIMQKGNQLIKPIALFFDDVNVSINSEPDSAEK